MRERRIEVFADLEIEWLTKVLSLSIHCQNFLKRRQGRIRLETLDSINLHPEIKGDNSQGYCP